MDVTLTRREKQKQYNENNNIIPRGVVKPIINILETDVTIEENSDEQMVVQLSPVQLAKEIKLLEKQMYKLASDLEFERAGEVRNQIKKLKDSQFKAAL